VRLRGAILFAALLPVAGCMVGPDYHRPEVPVPPAWGEASTMNAASGPSATTLSEWWLALHDPLLDRLVARALEANLSVLEAEARVRAARSLRSVAAADLFPTVNTNTSYSRFRNSTNAPGASGGSLNGHVENLYQAGFDASWELDLFGGIRRSVEAADADVGASVDDLRDVLVSLLGEVANQYVAYRGAAQQREIAENNVATQQATLELTRRRLAAGLASELDVVRAEAQVATTAAEIPTLETEERLAIHRLTVLLDTPLEELSAELAPAAPIPEADPSIPIGLPAELLRRRPDIRRAERQLAGATARIGVATADLYPRVTLLGVAGLESFRTSDFFDPASKFYSLGPALLWPVFDGGKIRAEIAVEDARAQELLAAYRLSILGAIAEVEDALVALDREKKRGDELAAAVQANQRAATLARQLYTEGLTDFLSVLDAERSLFESQDSFVASERTATLDLVALYKALGGGWETKQPEEGVVATASP
jgi:NodT family efflux transporter outer membrane factor (OMF) lipoprotein